MAISKDDIVFLRIDTGAVWTSWNALCKYTCERILWNSQHWATSYSSLLQ